MSIKRAGYVHYLSPRGRVMAVERDV